MTDSILWNELSRAHQRVLERLWGGGTVRGQDPAIVIGLERMGYVEGDELTPLGSTLCETRLREMMKRIALETPRSVAQHGPRARQYKIRARDADLQTLAQIAQQG